MSNHHPAADFVRAYHEALTDWFAGRRTKEASWQALRDMTDSEMTLVYPSGQRMNGRDFLQSIHGAYGSSQGFVASIERLELVHVGPQHAVVSYVEVQSGAKNSAAENRRSALALLITDDGGWKWRFIQETALS